jgi:MFS family permease
MADFEESVAKVHTGEQLTTCEILKEEAKNLKWKVLIVACFLTFGSYYIYDFPGAIGTGPHGTIEKKFREHGMAYTQEMNQALYSVYSWPNTVLAIFGGLLIDKYLGLRRAMLLFTSLVFLGALLFYIGVVTLQYPVMLLARVVFGLGGESLSVAQSAFVARWFKGGRGLALAFGITISFSRIGSSFNFLFSPMIATHKGIDAAVMAGMFACLISLTACFLLIACDVYAVNRGLIKPEAHEDEKNAMNLSDIKTLPRELWIICIICVFCYTAIFPFVGVAKNFFEVKFGYSGDEASSYISLYQFSSAAASPLIGGLVDSVGRNTLWLIAACSCFILIHFVMLVSAAPPYVTMVAMGLFYSFLVSGLWPSVPWVVPENVVGFSYGVMTALQNAGLAIFPLIVGGILDAYPGPSSNATHTKNMTNVTHTPAPSHTQQYRMLQLLDAASSSSSSSGGALPALEGYKYTELLFMASAAVSLLASIALLVCDMKGSGVLTSLAVERKAREALRNREKEPLINDDDTKTHLTMKTQEAF